MPNTTGAEPQLGAFGSQTARIAPGSTNLVNLLRFFDRVAVKDSRRGARRSRCGIYERKMKTTDFTDFEESGQPATPTRI